MVFEILCPESNFSFRSYLFVPERAAGWEILNMEKNRIDINIVGAGISGLIAALVLEKQGYAVSIYEKTDRAGGRVKTDMVDGFRMDHGFQVLLDAYPMVQKYLDFDSLKLRKFLPGAVIYKNGKKHTLGDPLRSISFLLPTLFSGIGTFYDTLKILALNRELKRSDFKTIFESKETTTQKYLESKGFSEDIISSFFKPFFSGIFLEPNLRTSSRMFQFIYKMFGEGLAVLPEKGIGAITEQLVSKLKTTEIVYNMGVKNVSGTTLVLEDGSTREASYTIIAANVSGLVSNLRNQEIQWKGCDALYFSSKQRNIEKPLIGLIADDGALINNIFYTSSLGTENSSTDELLCVMVVKSHTLDPELLITKVKEDLVTYCGISQLKFIKRYNIPRGLPDLTDIRYQMAASETQLTKSVFLAGDHLLNASLNAAMLSGERAAQGIMEVAEGNRGIVR